MIFASVDFPVACGQETKQLGARFDMPSPFCATIFS
jgi:hypothetical protein